MSVLYLESRTIFIIKKQLINNEQIAFQYKQLLTYSLLSAGAFKLHRRIIKTLFRRNLCKNNRNRILKEHVTKLVQKLLYKCFVFKKL